MIQCMMSQWHACEIAHRRVIRVMKLHRQDDLFTQGGLKHMAQRRPSPPGLARVEESPHFSMERGPREARLATLSTKTPRRNRVAGGARPAAEAPATDGPACGFP